MQVKYLTYDLNVHLYNADKASFKVSVTKFIYQYKIDRKKSLASGLDINLPGIDLHFVICRKSANNTGVYVLDQYKVIYYAENLFIDTSNDSIQQTFKCVQK